MRVRPGGQQIGKTPYVDKAIDAHRPFQAQPLAVLGSLPKCLSYDRFQKFPFADFTGFGVKIHAAGAHIQDTGGSQLPLTTPTQYIWLDLLDYVEIGLQWHLAVSSESTKNILISTFFYWTRPTKKCPGRTRSSEHQIWCFRISPKTVFGVRYLEVISRSVRCQISIPYDTSCATCSLYLNSSSTSRAHCPQITTHISRPAGDSPMQFAQILCPCRIC